MRLSFLGLGKLGLPLAAVFSRHHQVTGYDPDPSTASRLVVGHPWEQGLEEYLGDIALAGSAEAAIADAEVVVVCVQTPHHPRLDGTHPDDGTRAPFDLTYLHDALRIVGRRGVPVVVMSTVLPGDCANLADLVSNLVYAPAFPAMGTTISDFLNPEFILAGLDPDQTADGAEIHRALFEPVYGPDYHRLTRRMSWESAELAKVSYNTAVTLKITLANTVAWMANESGADGAVVMEVIKAANRRIISDAYLRPGMGDAGACHPRDLIAISYLCKQLGVYDIYSDLIAHREQHSEWVASAAAFWADTEDLDPVILGAEYKPDSTLTDGSPGRLLANQTGWPIVSEPPTDPCVVVVAVPHTRYRDAEFGESVVIDPWGIIDQRQVSGAGQVVRPGRL